MSAPNLFASRVFRYAGWYGILVLAPQYFLEKEIARMGQPPVAHPEFYYGFVGVALAWQLAFLIIASEPARYRPLMLPAVLEKLSFGIAAIVLVALGRTAPMVIPFAAIDLTLGSLFAVAWWRLRGESSSVVSENRP
jgi:hypothetical protein